MTARVRVLAPLLLLLLAALPLRAEEEWKLTGSSVRVKTVMFVDVNVYRIESHVKTFPATKSRQALIDLEADKKLTWTMLRDVEAEKLHRALADAFALNGYEDAEKIKAFVGAFKGELKEKSHVTIVYDAAQKETTVSVDSGGGKATVSGVAFMKGVWSIWLGKIDQEKLGDELIAKLP